MYVTAILLCILLCVLLTVLVAFGSFCFIKFIHVQSVFFLSVFQGIFVVGDIGDVVTEASVAADSSLSRHLTDRH